MFRERMRHTSPRHRQIKPILVLITATKNSSFFLVRSKQVKEKHCKNKKYTKKPTNMCTRFCIRKNLLKGNKAKKINNNK